MMLGLSLIPLLLFALGMTCLVRGLRGRRMDDHPICRRCGFDLFGRREESTVCSECGTDLLAPKAVRIGRRERRKASLGLGAGLLIGLLAGVGWVGWLAHGGFDFNPYKPTSWLVREAMDPPTATAAARELVKRLAAHRLSDAQATTMADRLLAFQGDANRAWIPSVGDVIEQAKAGGYLAPERWLRYLNQAPQCTLVVRPKVNRGDPMVFELDTVRWRTAVRSTVVGSSVVARWKINELWYPLDRDRNFDRSNNVPGRTRWHFFLDKKIDGVADGPQTLTIVIELAIADRSSPGVPPMSRPLTLSAPFELLPTSPPGPSSVRELRDPSVGPAIAQSLKVAFAPVLPPRRDYVSATLQIADAPVGVAFDVWAKSGNGREVRAGSLAAGARQRQWTHLMFPLADSTAGHFDLILKPNRQIAANTLDLSEVWMGDDIVLGDIAVPPPATKSTSPTRTTATKPTERTKFRL